VCTEKKTNNVKEWEKKYLHACANSAIALPIISRNSFKGRNFDIPKYVWSSNPDDLLMEWDLMLELYDRGRLKDILPCLVGDVTDATKQKSQARIMQKLGIDQLDEAHVTHRIRELFKFADQDQSGFIDRNEMSDCFQKFGLGLTDDELKAVYAMFDTQSPDLLRDHAAFDDEAGMLADAAGVTKKAKVAGVAVNDDLYFAPYDPTEFDLGAA